MNSDLVTIIIPSYNHVKFINELFLSIINLNFNKKQIEIVISDDNSADDTYTQVKAFKDKYRRDFFDIIINKNDVNLGMVKNINNSIRISNGNFIKIIASDDMLQCDSINVMYDFLKNNQTVDFAFSNAYITYESDKYNINSNDYRLLYSDGEYISNLDYNDLFLRNYIAAPTVMFKKSVFDKYGLFDERFDFEDYPYWLRICNECKYLYIDLPTVYYRYIFKTSSNNSERMIKMANTYITLLLENYVKVTDIKKRKLGIINFISKAYNCALKSKDQNTIMKVKSVMRDFGISKLYIHIFALKNYLSILKKKLHF